VSDSSGEKVAIIGTHGFEPIELARLLEALRKADVQVGVVSSQHG
jgi:putative intracellular protease/amidase